MNVNRPAVALAVVLTLASALPALAHAHLLSAFPEPDSVITEPPEVLIVLFTEEVEADLTGLAVTRNGVDIPHQTVVPNPVDPATVSIRFDVPLAPGKYDIDWHTVASDGHKSNGSYSFTVAQ